VVARNRCKVGTDARSSNRHHLIQMLLSSDRSRQPVGNSVKSLLSIACVIPQPFTCYMQSDLGRLRGDTEHTNVSRFSRDEIRAGTTLIVLPDKRSVLRAFS